jgi:peptidoglycan/xylan/chitin deacetylase (PgdA/CDA1 family)
MNLRPSMWLRQAVRWGLTLVVPRRRYLVRGPRRASSVCLTFDDGPHPVYTPRLLDVLKAEGVAATFFMIGREAERHPEVVLRAAAEGHVLGSHSYSHRPRWTLSVREATDEAVRGAGVIGSIIGSEPTLYRPPQGKVTGRDLWGLWGRGQTVVLWNADPKDYARPKSADVLEWFADWKFRGGDVILMHDNHPHAPEVVSELVRRVRAAGLGFATVKDWAV